MQEPKLHNVNIFERANQAAHILVFLARTIACPVEACMRRGFGIKYFGMQALAAAALLPLWAGFWPRSSPEWLNAFWFVSLLMLVRARVESARMANKGVHVHSRYNGWPRLARAFKRSSETRIKQKWEPATCLLAGILVAEVDLPLGSYLMVAAVAMFFVTDVIEAAERSRAMELYDAFIEQQSIAERFRDMQRSRSV